MGAGLILMVCGLLTVAGGPVVGATTAAASLSGGAVARWTVPLLTQAVACSQCIRRDVQRPPRPSVGQTLCGLTMTVLGYTLVGSVDLWGSALVAAVLWWSVYVGVVTVGALALATVHAQPIVRRYTLGEDAELPDADRDDVDDVDDVDAELPPAELFTPEPRAELSPVLSGVLPAELFRVPV